MSNSTASIYQSKDYRPFNLTSLCHKGRVLPFTSQLPVLESLRAADIVNPVIGKMKVTAFEFMPEQSSALNLLLDQVESILTAKDPKPLLFWGQRSPVFRLEQPFDSGNRHIDGLQLKAYLYQPLGTGEVSFPIMREYKGIGVPAAHRYFNMEGRIQQEKPLPRPVAAMFLENARQEAFQAYHWSSLSEYVTPPFGYVEFKDQNFMGQKVGFVVHMIEGVQRIRGFEYLRKIISDMGDSATMRSTAQKIFADSGKMLANGQLKGFGHGYFHLENVSFDPTNLSSPAQPRTHDFDNTFHIKDITPAAYFGMALMDLCEFLFAPAFALTERAKFQKPDHDLIRSLAKSENIDLQETEIVLEWFKGMFGPLQNPAIVAAKPAQSFLQGYFGSLGETLRLPQSMLEQFAQQAYYLLIQAAAHSQGPYNYLKSTSSLPVDQFNILPRAVFAKLSHLLN